MGIFQRLFNIGSAEAHSAIDKLENPVKMTEKGIRDLKKDLAGCMESLAEIKAMRIRSASSLEETKHRAQNYEAKAIQLLKKAERGGLDVAEADRLATEALKRKNEVSEEVNFLQNEVEQLDQRLDKLNAQVKKLRSMIAQYENELRTLKARSRVSKATTKINKSMARIDSSDTVSMLEKMKNKVAQQEALAQAYGEISEEPKSVDNEIDDALEGELPSSDAASDLEALKRKLKNN